jgi:hypothetical protein
MSKDFLRKVSSTSRDLLDPAGKNTFNEESPSNDAPAPVTEPTPVMPIADDEEIKKKKRRSITEQRQRQGRASTFMTSNDTLGAA